jgi:hypothetical protein
MFFGELEVQRLVIIMSAVFVVAFSHVKFAPGAQGLAMCKSKRNVEFRFSRTDESTEKS